MRRSFILLAVSGFLVCLAPQSIFRIGISGIALKGFSPSETIDGFTVSGPDQEGYVYLVAHAGQESAALVRTNRQGVAFRSFHLEPGERVAGFQTRGPDAQGYVYLVALASDGSRGEILRTKWQGSAVQAYSPPDGVIQSLTVTGPNAEGYLCLVVGTPHVEESASDSVEPLKFTFDEIASPVVNGARISYSLDTFSRVSLVVYDATGRLVASLVDAEQAPGSHELIWDARGKGINSGVYLVTLNAGNFKATKKLVVAQ